MTRRNIKTVSMSLLTIATLAALSVSGHAKPSDVAALRRADGFFGADRGLWNTYIVDPLARRQAVRKLDRLSKSLYDLANEKQELAEALSSRGGGADRVRAKTSIANFKDIVRQVRHDIEDFSSILPEGQREEGMNVARELFEGLSLKWQTLDRAERLIDERGAGSEQVFNELRAAAKQVMGLKSKVDGLIQSIQTH